LIRVEGVIGPTLAAYLDRKLDEAKADGADLVVLEIDSPGGKTVDSWAMAGRLRDLDFAHTVAYVPRRALSGAAVMALGCDEIIMAPTALIGDAGTIYQDENSQFRFAPRKSSVIWPRNCGDWPPPRVGHRRWPRRWWTRACKSSG